MTTPAAEPAAVPAPDAPIRWGILATGKIAHTFAEDLALVPDAELVAVGSRSQESADAFAARHGGRAHATYAALAEDPEVDVVYLASPHSHHLEHARLCLEAGKHVLCEKPLTLTVADAEAMVALAARHQRFLMEAMWTACHPVVRTLARDLRAGVYGAPRHLHAELGFVVPDDPSSRMLDPALGASALLDMGIYPLTIAHLLLGEAEALTGQAVLSDRGIDLDVAMTGRYPGGALATMTASVTSWSSRRAFVATDRGRIDIPEFHHPEGATFTPYDPEGSNDGSDHAAPVAIEDTFEGEPVIGRGYGNEVLEVHRCLRAGLLESPLVPHAQTLTLMRQLEDVLHRVGVRFADARG